MNIYLIYRSLRPQTNTKLYPYSIEKLTEYDLP